MNPIATRLTKVRQRIEAAASACGRDPATIRLLAVSKTKPVEDVRTAYAAGQRAFGENYLQDALPKIAELAELALEWHFIGRLQGNKTEAIAHNFAWVHGLDKAKHARLLDRHRDGISPPLQVCIQLNLSGEESKGGIAPPDLPGLAATITALPNLTLRGLMTMPRPDAPAAELESVFGRLAELLSEIQAIAPEADTLSMGMSGDMVPAIRAGSTLVRIGTDIFGPRA